MSRWLRILLKAMNSEFTQWHSVARARVYAPRTTLGKWEEAQMPFRVAIKCPTCFQRHTIYIQDEKLPPRNARVKFGCPKLKDDERFTITTLPKGELAPSVPENGIVGTLLS